MTGKTHSGWTNGETWAKYRWLTHEIRQTDWRVDWQQIVDRLIADGALSNERISREEN